jgi:hypothetical protein
MKFIDIMDRLPSATDTSLRADLSRIKYYRNMIVHCNDALVEDTDFESYWNDVTTVIHNNITSVHEILKCLLTTGLMKIIQ